MSEFEKSEQNAVIRRQVDWIMKQEYGMYIKRLETVFGIPTKNEWKGGRIAAFEDLITKMLHIQNRIEERLLQLEDRIYKIEHSELMAISLGLKETLAEMEKHGESK